MIAKISFTGTVRTGRKKSILPDYILVHATDVKTAKDLFLEWVEIGAGIRGMAAFHPLGVYGAIKIDKVTENE